MKYNKDNLTVSFSQLAHDFAILKLKSKIDKDSVETYGDFLETYIDELDTMKSYLKSVYGEDIFTK